MTAIVQFPTATPPSGVRVPADLSGTMGDMPDPDRGSLDADVALRQLRHQTKNALQRILCHVANQSGLTDSAAGRALARDLERRIHLVATVSDALFGFTKAPDPLEQRLISLGRSVVELLCDPGQLIDVDVIVQGHCPRSLDEVIVRVAHELVGNAVKHGMHVRLVGRIDIAVRTVGQMTTLTVSDDGWGYSANAQPGEGLSVAMALAEPFGGTLQMRRDRDRTHVSLTLPHAARRPAMSGHHFA
jgi:two-component sensor histidine kinase